MSEQMSGKPRCEVCGGVPSWTCPATKVVLCEGCMHRPGIGGGIDHAIPGIRGVCSHWIDGATGDLRILSYEPAQRAQQ